jgi:hypothetical protein
MRCTDTSASRAYGPGATADQDKRLLPRPGCKRARGAAVGRVELAAAAGAFTCGADNEETDVNPR